jgi:hypothetical protein
MKNLDSAGNNITVLEKGYYFTPLKCYCQKSLPSSLFQREESFAASGGRFLPLLLPLYKEDEGGL